MNLSESQKNQIKLQLAQLLRSEPEVRKVVVFGSFAISSNPNDLDVAIFQDTNQSYLPPAMKYRRLLRPVADRIALDVVPVHLDFAGGNLSSGNSQGRGCV